MAKEVSINTFIVLSILFVLISVSITVLFLSRTQELTTITGAVSGVARVEVVCLTAISLPVSAVDFGVVLQGTTDDTADNNPAPMVVQNDGGIGVDVSIARDSSSTPLFSGTGGGDNTDSFQFKIDNSTEANSFDYLNSTTNWTNVPGTTSLDVVIGLKYSDSQDSAEIDLKIQVPVDEPIGIKNETLNFIAVPSEGAECGDEGNSCKDRFWECSDICHNNDSDCYLSCGHTYSICIRGECISELQACKDNCTSSQCRKDCNDIFKECAKG